MPLVMEVGLSPGDFGLVGDPAHLPPKMEAEAGGMQSPPGLGLRDIVFDVDPATSRKRAHPPHPILAHVCGGQMAGWMKTPLGTEVDLDRDHIVLDGVPVPAKAAQQPTSFRPMSIVATVAHLSYC